MSPHHAAATDRAARVARRPARARPERVTRARAHGRTRGFSLIVAMLMLAVIGLASAAIMRNALSGGQVANGNRLQAQANQYAQLALRFCQTQMQLAPTARVVTLLPAAAPPAWTVQRNWASTGTSAAHTLAAREIGASVQPRVAPQCLMEATSVRDVYTITARGFSADFKADPVTGATRTGSAVWVQATLHAESDAGASGLAPAAVGTVPAGTLFVKQRVWQQLLTPPF